MNDPKITKVKLSDIQPDLANANQHTERGTAMVSNSIQEHGFIDAGTLDKDNRIANGNSRTEIASGQGANEAYVIEFPERNGTPVYLKYNDLDLETEEGRRAAYALNRTAQLSIDWNPEQVAADLQAGVNLDGLFQDFELEDMLDGLEVPGFGDNEGDDTEPQIDRADELRQEWQTETGKLWQLGEHRLICGDCTDKSVVDKVMGGEKAEMMFTDPPYGVNYEGGHFNPYRKKLANDNTSDIYSWFLPIVIPFVDGPCYTWFADSGGKPVYDAITKNDCQIHALLIWNKTNATYAAMNAQYKQRHEPCLYFKPKGSTLRWDGPTNECTVWDIARDAVNDKHPTQKPILLAERAIRNHKAETALDPFLGSGTTLIACENLGRKCRAIEIDPGYVAVCLQRYFDHTGDKPVLVDTITTV